MQVPSVPTWGLAKASYFQSPGVTNDTNVNTLMGSMMVDLYSAIVRELASHKGRLFAIRDTTLVNTGTSDSLAAWLGYYSQAYMILRAAQSCLDAGGINYTMQLISAAVNENLPLLLATFGRLADYSVPPMLLEMLDCLSGVKTSEDDNLVYVAGINSATLAGALPGDLTSAAIWASLIQFARSSITALTAGAVDLAAADAQAIGNIFSYAYGEPKIKLEKGVSADEGEYAMQKFRAVAWRDTALNLYYAYPNTNVIGATNIAPVVVPRNYTGGSLKYILSLMRTSVYSAIPILGSSSLALGPNMVGLFNSVLPIAAGETQFGLYAQDAIFNRVDEAGPAAVDLTWKNAEINGLPWTALAASKQTNYTLDQRTYPKYDYLWLNKDWLIDETIYLIECMFLDPIRANGGSFV
jgi:hypothetical protein